MASRALKTVEQVIDEKDRTRNIAQRIAAVMGEVDYVQTSIDFARFFEKVVVLPNSVQCWEWVGGTDPDGYGIFSAGGKPYRAHRWIFSFICDIPDGLVVRHKCDNPRCVNTRHLELGTVADNKRDEIERGRSPDRKGEKHPSSLLTEDQVREIRKRVSCGERHHVLARQYGVSRQHIGKICNLETWGHLA